MLPPAVPAISKQAHPANTTQRGERFNFERLVVFDCGVHVLAASIAHDKLLRDCCQNLVLAVTYTLLFQIATAKFMHYRRPLLFTGYYYGFIASNLSISSYYAKYRRFSNFGKQCSRFSC
jgi:hypothetical protein